MIDADACNFPVIEHCESLVQPKLRKFAQCNTGGALARRKPILSGYRSSQPGLYSIRYVK
jgi:hypothetical protein